MAPGKMKGGKAMTDMAGNEDVNNLGSEVALDSMVGLQSVVPHKWRLNEPGFIDKTTAKRSYGFVTPPDFNAQQLWGSTNEVTFTSNSKSNFVFLDEAFIEMQMQLQSTATATGGYTINQPYPSGTPIALVPDISSSFIEGLLFTWGGQSVESRRTYAWISTYVQNYLEFSYDYTVGQKGYWDVWILDSAGSTQSTSLTTSLSPYANKQQVGSGSIIVTDTTSGAILELNANSSTVLGIKAISGTITAGDTITLALPGPSGTTIPIYAVHTAGGIAITSFTVGTVTSGSAPLTLNAGSSMTATDAIVFFAGAQQLALYDTAPTKPVLITTTATSSATASTVTMAVGSAGTITTGDLLSFSPNSAIVLSNNASGFARRQALTDGSTFYTVRIPIKRFVNFFKTWNRGLYGQDFMIKLYVTSNIASRMLQHAQFDSAGNAIPDGQIYVSQILLVVPYEEPSPQLAGEIANWLKSGQPIDFIWNTVSVQPFPSIASGANSYNQSITSPIDSPEWFIMVTIPSSYINNQLSNPQCSIVPAVSSTTSNVVTNAYLQYGVQKFPDTPYGQNRSSSAEIWDVILQLCGRTDNELFSPAFDYQQFLLNQYMLAFDMRGRAGDSQSAGSNITLSVQYANNFSQLCYVYILTLGRRPAAFKPINGQMIYVSSAV